MGSSSSRGRALVSVWVSSPAGCQASDMERGRGRVRGTHLPVFGFLMSCFLPASYVLVDRWAFRRGQTPPPYRIGMSGFMEAVALRASEFSVVFLEGACCARVAWDSHRSICWK